MCVCVCECVSVRACQTRFRDLKRQTEREAMAYLGCSGLNPAQAISCTSCPMSLSCVSLQLSYQVKKGLTGEAKMEQVGWE